MINTTFTNGLFFFGTYLNDDMTGFKYITKGDGNEFPKEISLSITANPEEGFSVVYKNATETSPSNTEVSASGAGAVVQSDKRVVILSTKPAPTSPTDEGFEGERREDENYSYRYLNGSWKRSDYNIWVAETE